MRMIRILGIVFGAVLACMPAALAANPGAPPVAGAHTTGGQGGRTVVVTSLEDDGPGSLREALASLGPKTITFAVGGDIWLRSSLIVRHPHVTLAGETAPSPGITLRGSTVRIKASDVIMRHLRVRVGDGPGEDPDDRDGIAILGSPTGKRVVTNVVIDHCSVSWAIDEDVSTWYPGVSSVTISNSIIAETLNDSIHPKGRHSMGLLIGRFTKGVLIYRNLLIHNNFRNPGLAAGATVAMVNNLIYDPGYRALQLYARSGSTDPTLVSAADNLVVAGPATPPRMGFFGNGVVAGSRIYLKGNRTDGTEALEPTREGIERLGFDPFVADPPVTWDAALEVVPAKALEATLAPDVGARPWDRDATDRRLLRELKERRGRVRDTVPEGERGR